MKLVAMGYLKKMVYNVQKIEPEYKFDKSAQMLYSIIYSEIWF